MSVRSEKMMFPTHRRGANSGSESESGYNRRRNRRGDSDNESDVSAIRNARRRREAESGSESESGHRQRRRERHSRRSAENLTYSEEKWKSIQSRVRDGGGRYDGMYDPYNGQIVMPNGSMSSIPASEASHHSHNRRKRRTRSKSPGNKRPPEELAQHFRYVEPEPGLTDEQLRDIPYTAVQTTVAIPRRKISPHRYRHKSRERRSMGEYSEKSASYHQQAPAGDDDLNRSHILPREEPPPPYSAPIPPPAAYANRHSQPAYPFYTANNYRNSGELQESVHPPASVYKNQTYSAPIVKTKGHDDGIGPGSHYPQHYPGTMIDGPTSQQGIYTDQIGNDQTDGSSMMVKHTRDDSGLGPDHSEGPSPASQSGSSRSMPTGPMSPNTQMTPLGYKSASKPVFIEQGLSDGHRTSNHNESTQGQGHGHQGQGHSYQPHNLPTPTSQYNGHGMYNAPPTSYGYYTPPYMAKTYAPSPKSMGNNSSFSKETTFSSPYKPKPNQSSPIGSLSRGVSSPFKPVVPSVNRKSSSQMGNMKNGQVLSQNNNVKYNNANDSKRSNHVNGNVNSEVLRKVIASPGTNKDLLTEL